MSWTSTAADRTQPDHKALIERLQEDARRMPERYRMRVALLAAAGFGVLLLILLLAVGLPLALIVAIFASDRPFHPSIALVLAPQLAFAGFVVHALWVRFAPPDGHRLSAEEAPELVAEVERLRIATGAPPLEGIVIDGDLNAGAASMPRLLGLLGYRHYLVIGLPLMRLLDRNELAAVIAHEFGHFGGGHGRFSAWIYRVRISWYRLLNALSSRGGLVSLLFVKFFRWYVPYFNAYSFVMAREDEYEADAMSARVVGDESRISALIRIEHASQWLQKKFWPNVEARMRAHPHPPTQIQHNIATALRESPPIDIERLLAATERENDLTDTHPTLPQRVAAVGGSVALREPQSAAVGLLGDALPRIEQTLNAAWRKEIESSWSEAYAQATADRQRLELLESKGQPTAEEQLQHAQLVEAVRPDFDALRLYRRVLERTPDSAMAHFRSGLLQLERNEPAGTDALRRAMELDVGAIRLTMEHLQSYARDATIDVMTAAAIAKLHADFTDRARSLEIRDDVAAEDELIAHDFDEAMLHRLGEALARIDQVGQAWLVRKRLDMAEEAPHYTLLVTWRGSVVSEAAGLKRIVAAWTLPGSVSVLTDSEHKQLARRVRERCPQPVYRRSR